MRKERVQFSIGLIALSAITGSGCSSDTLTRLIGHLEAEPLELDFGRVPIHTSVSRTNTLTSTGTRTVVIDGFSIENATPAYQVNATPISLRVGSTVELVVLYEPNEPGTHDDVLVIESDADEGELFRVTLTAEAYDPCIEAFPKLVGQPCLASQGVCEQPGFLTCNADLSEAICEPDLSQELQCCPPGQALDEQDQCCRIVPIDNDGDGYGDGCGLEADCDDNDASRNPGAEEICNGIDDNCDDRIDEVFGVGELCEATFVCVQGGTCGLEGVTTCSENGQGSACRLNRPGEICDNIDNDCNCIIDDPFPQLGLPCLAPQGVCEQPGFFSCSADFSEAICEPDFSQQLQCCPPGQSLNEQQQCCPVMPLGPCQYSCTVDLSTASHDCAQPATVVSLDTQYGRLDLNMDPDQDATNGSQYNALMLTFEVCDPSQWVFSLADSPSCNGFSGDGSDASNDAELHLGPHPGGAGTTLLIYGNDYAPATGRLLLDVPDFVATTGCTQTTLWAADQRVLSRDACFEVGSPYTTRIYPPSDDQGPVDAMWYLGLNRVVSSTSRSGGGLRQVELCFQ